jgi:hypothetical protein
MSWNYFIAFQQQTHNPRVQRRIYPALLKAWSFGSG